MNTSVYGRFLAIAGFAVATLSSCTQQSKQGTASQPDTTNAAPQVTVPMKWMLGNWEMRSDSMLITESWEQVSDSLCVGTSFVMMGNDTLLREGLQMRKEGNNWVYFAKVNNSEPVPFRLNPKPDPKGEVFFENPQHDFPQYIHYVRVNENEMMAEVSGTEHGQEHNEKFTYKRVK